MLHSQSQSIHKARYRGTDDPGAVGAGIEWLDENFDPPVQKIRNADNDDWDVALDPADFAEAGAAPTGSAGGDLTGTYPNPTIANDAVSLAKMANLATDTVIGRTSSGTGDPEAVTFTDQAQQLCDDTSFGAMRTTLGLGTSSTLDSDNDTTLGSGSSSLLPTQNAVKAYVDGKVAGLSWKTAVRVATTAAGTLASSFENGDTVDGVTLATGDRILIKDQSSGAENGIYVVNASGAPTRATDADSSAELVDASVFVAEGTTNADTQWKCTNNAPITVGTTALTWIQHGGGTTYTADETSIHLSGTQFQIKSSAALPGSPTTTTQSPGDNSTKVATTAYVDTAAASAGAPTNADYLVKTANGSLSAERVVTDTTTVTWDWATSGQAKAQVVDGSISGAKATNGMRDVAIPFIIDGGGSAITTGRKGGFEIPFAGTIVAARVFALDGNTGSIVLDLWKNTYANFPPAVADTITASAKPTISSATKAQDTTLTGWTTSVSAGDIIFVNVDSITTLTRALLSLTIRRS